MTGFNRQHADSLADAAAVCLNCMLGDGPEVYPFGQSFVGYGENLLDHNRQTTRLRICGALVR